jgi:hypothetical protein
MWKLLQYNLVYLISSNQTQPTCIKNFRIKLRKRIEIDKKQIST